MQESLNLTSVGLVCHDENDLFVYKLVVTTVNKEAIEKHQKIQGAYATVHQVSKLLRTNEDGNSEKIKRSVKLDGIIQRIHTLRSKSVKKEEMSPSTRTCKPCYGKLDRITVHTSREVTYASVPTKKGSTGIKIFKITLPNTTKINSRYNLRTRSNNNKLCCQ